MTAYGLSSADACRIADDASEAIRALNHATLPADGCPGLQYPSDAYVLLGALAQLAQRLPQLLEQISAFLQRELQLDLVTVDGGKFAGDPLAAIGTACHQLEGGASQAARRLADALDAAQQALAFTGQPDDSRAT